jgi:hypothetical protein
LIRINDAQEFGAALVPFLLIEPEKWLLRLHVGASVRPDAVRPALSPSRAPGRSRRAS